LSNLLDIEFDMMKAIQIVIDEDLLKRVDRSARRLKSSRSAAIRRLVELGLENEALTALARVEAEAYARTPESRPERDAFRALTRSQQRVMGDLTRTDPW
jgi:metal-responsive CopG/Arc/MetJ family transcriptional regulator